MSNELYELFRGDTPVKHGAVSAMLTEDGETTTEVKILGYVATNTGSNEILAGLGQRGDGRFVAFSWNAGSTCWEIDASRVDAAAAVGVVAHRMGGVDRLTVIWLVPDVEPVITFGKGGN